ncbi:putative thioesterase [Bordetella holmesii 44057]|nr:putative thioesterase [Bordetella holmesii ATCC 51541]AIT25711.1 putative thioesterase [Bordetella holmesii 44057]
MNPATTPHDRPASYHAQRRSGLDRRLRPHERRSLCRRLRWPGFRTSGTGGRGPGLHPHERLRHLYDAYPGRLHARGARRRSPGAATALARCR